MDLRRISNDDEARALAGRLLAAGERKVPLVVLTTARGEQEPFADAEAIKREFGDQVEVAVLLSGTQSWVFSESMPPDTSVYGGACRVYPPDQEWETRPGRIKVRFAYSPIERQKITTMLIDDVRKLLPEQTPKSRYVDPRNARIDELETDLENLQERYRKVDQARIKAVKELRSVSGRLEADIADGPYFLDPEEEFRFEVYVEWVRRIAPAEKANMPLADYDIGPAFLASVDAVDGISRAKIVAVVVEVLTGLAATLGSRDMHVLREGNEPIGPAMTRADGGVCWRVALQRESPSARRLHFWKIGDRVELSRVVLHDDFRP